MFSHGEDHDLDDVRACSGLYTTFPRCFPLHCRYFPANCSYRSSNEAPEGRIWPVGSCTIRFDWERGVASTTTTFAKVQILLDHRGNHTNHTSLSCALYFASRLGLLACCFQVSASTVPDRWSRRSGRPRLVSLTHLFPQSH